MEPNESQHIIQNISKLSEFTIVNTNLLAELIQADVISKDEQYTLLDHSSPQAQSLGLYHLLRTRDCYDKIRTALEKTKQLGAFKILDSLSKVQKSSALTRRGSTQDKHLIAENIYKGEMAIRIKQDDYISEDGMKELHDLVCRKTEMLCLQTKVLERHELNTIEEKLHEVFRTTEWHEILDNPPVLSDEFTPTIGIDLGTKNCVVGVYINTDEKVKIIEFVAQQSFANYVLFENSGEVVTGDIAKRCAYENPENTIFDSKRLLGRSKKEIQADTNLKLPFKITFGQGRPFIVARGIEYRPEEISAMLLKHCKDEAERILKIKVTKAVVTVPAYFNDHQRNSTLEACKIAGLKVLHLLNEPVAAVIAYKQQRLTKTATKVLVFEICSKKLETMPY